MSQITRGNFDGNRKAIASVFSAILARKSCDRQCAAYAAPIDEVIAAISSSA